MTALLDIRGLTANYGDFQALFGVDLTLDQGQTVAIIGLDVNGVPGILTTTGKFSALGVASSNPVNPADL